ncbi:MAG: 3-oxoacyl-ACP reductase FabG [Candidatus Shapirobacteria bacterium]|nr:3-oxoacyl-ACP reductase FabG [Candidatus Shapirobacteria bacterium]MDD5073849.1 3-oxoacyl-ACP reductase FabG [Candidatus Shapirobacteria bacterium]MDD5481726.1 3-oxoacyl-ACP reductase FabG [Candidatus Shapirobacteria bacterium]
MFDLTGKIALVTGASRGIGQGIALCLAKQGADVAVNYHSSADQAQEVVKKIEDLGQKSIAVRADVSKSDQVKAMVEKTVQEFGRLDILVNNAGVLNYKTLDQMTEEDWDWVIDTNLKGQFLCVKAAAPLMEKNGWGRIINIASVASGGVGVGYPALAHYCASKGGVVALTEGLAVELGVKGITVNAIAPGAVETDMAKGVTEDEQVKQGLLARLPIKRIGQPEDIGAAAVFLASDEASYLTGSVIYVDGGWLAA